MRIPHGLRAALASQASPPPPPTPDANFENVSLLLHGDGTNGAQNNTFIDGSTNNFTITRNGNTTQGTFSPFSPTGWSGYFDGSGTTTTFDGLYTSTSTAFDLRTTGTVECWVFPTARSTSASAPQDGNSTVFAFYGTSLVSATKYYALNITIDGFLSIKRDASNEYTSNVSTTSIPLNQWTHIAWVRTSGANKFYVNGADVTSTFSDPNLASWPTSATTNEFYIGITPYKYSAYTYLAPFQGYISNLRVLQGTALYTSAFTPPTAPLTAITNTSLLTLQDNRFKDNSTNNFTITRNGDTRIEAFSPFNPTAAYSASTHGGSGYFDGTGDYLSVANNAAFAFGTGDFTWEFWLYRTSSFANNLTIFDQRATSATANGIADFINTNDKYSLYANNAVVYTSTAIINISQWTHIAVARSGSTLRVFINGSLDGSVSNSMNLSDQSLLIGTNRGITAGSISTGFFNGYISNLRILKGTALYTSNFTPPTAPLTAITNTSLLLNFTNAGIIDNASKNVLETVGNAQISTSVKKFGTGSLAFDGSGDYLLSPPNLSSALGTGDFTVEAWVYASGTQTRFANIVSSASLSWYLSFENSNQVFFWINSAGAGVYSSSNLTSNTWVHVAASRSGTTLRLFFDGVQVGSATLSASAGTSNDPVRVGYNGISHYFNGYIDDLRITKGVARYTANFTPPTQAFPDL